MNIFLEKIKNTLRIVSKTPTLLLASLIAFSLLTSIAFQQSVEVAVLRLLFIYCSFQISNYVMKNNFIYKKELSEEKINSEKEHSIIVEQNFVSKWIDSFIYTLGGERQTFHLTSVSYSFLVVKPVSFNLPFIVFCRFNQYSWFKRIFQIILMYPYFITEVWIGKTLFGINFFILVIYPNIISMVVLIESFFYFLGLIIFFRFEGVYQYCIDTYGTEFVEKYIGNPGSASFMKKLGSKVVVFSATAVVGSVAAVAVVGAVAAIDITDQSYRNDIGDKKLDAMIARHEKLGHTITPDELKVIEKDISKENLTLLKQVTKAVLELKKK